MKIAFTDFAVSDLEWLHAYYSQGGPDSQAKADEALANSLDILLENPFLGHVHEDVERVRTFPILKTPFRLYYSVSSTVLTVLRVWDTRQDPDALSFE